MTDSPANAPQPIRASGARPGGMSRRGLLLSGGALGLLAAAAPVTEQAVKAAAGADERADENTDGAPVMRSPRHAQIEIAADSGPDLPGVGVIAYNRMAFGPRPGDLHAFDRLGATAQARLEAFVEEQLNPAEMDDSECDATLAAANFATLDKSLATLWADHVQGGMDRYQPTREVERATFLRAVYSKRQLAEVLADHWHNHFNVYGWEYWVAPTFAYYDRRVIRRHLLGNFREMLEAVAQSPAMLYYLDNQSNTSAGPNENFARELFELHTLGAENYFGVRAMDDPEIVDANGQRRGYIDDDVYGATTCFTGWRVNTNTGLFEYDAGRHFPYQKFVLGRVIPANQEIKDGHDVLDMLAFHPGTARHVCRRLCRRFIGDHPPERIVQEAADVFYANRERGDQLKRVVRTILLSPEFQTTWGRKIKRPFEYVVSLLRASKANFYPDDSFIWNYNNTGQGLFRWSPPDGYPDHRAAWATTMPMLQRWRRANWLLDWKIGGDGANKDELRLQLETQMPADKVRPAEIADFWIDRILGRPMPVQERQAIVDFMAHGRNEEYELPAEQIAGRLRYMVTLIFLSPSFHWR